MEVSDQFLSGSYCLKIDNASSSIANSGIKNAKLI